MDGREERGRREDRGRVEEGKEREENGKERRAEISPSVISKSRRL